MMHTRQDDPLAHMSGVGVTDEGKLKGTWGSSLPPWFQTKTYKSPGFTTADQAAGDKFYQKLAALTNRSVDTLWKDRIYAVPNGNFVAAIMNALTTAGGVSANDASALASYAGGSGKYKGLFGTTSTGLSTSDFLSADNMLAESTDVPILYSDALLRLKKINPAAHEYIVSLVGAKAAKRQMQMDIQLAQDTQKVIKKELEIVQKTAETAANVATSAAEGAKGAFDVAAFLARNWLWIASGVVLVGGYLLYRNRATVGRAAAAYYTGGTSELARRFAK